MLPICYISTVVFEPGNCLSLSFGTTSTPPSHPSSSFRWWLLHREWDYHRGWERLMHKWMAVVGCSAGDDGEPAQEHQAQFGEGREKETEGEKLRIHHRERERRGQK